MLFKVCQGAGVALLFCAGSALAVDDMVEHVLPPIADSYNYEMNQPHGHLNFMPVFERKSNNVRSVAMIAFDLTGLGVDPADVASARLEFTVASAQNNYGMGGAAGVFQVFERAFGFDEDDPNPAIAMIGDPLVELVRNVNDVSLLTLESDLLTSMVQMWMTDPMSNHGLDLALIPLDGADATFWMALRTKEWMNPDQHPRLVITEIPVPSTALLVLAGALGVAKRRR